MKSPWTTFLTLVIWFFAALLLGAQGLFAAPGGLPWPLLVAILLPLLAYGLDTRLLGGRLFQGLRALDRSTLVALQTWRVGGAFFVIEWWRGHLPAGFALLAGTGDILVGLAAPLVAGWLARGKGERAFVWWNRLGLLDLVLAVSAGVTHASGPLGIFSGTVPSDPAAHYPLSIVPSFLVPLAVIMHLRGFALASGATLTAWSSHRAHAPAPAARPGPA